MANVLTTTFKPQKRKKAGDKLMLVPAFSKENPAATYSPTPSRVQYHRRWKA